MANASTSGVIIRCSRRRASAIFWASNWAGRPDPAKLDLNSAGREEVNLMEDIGRAYALKVDWTEASYLPWVDGGPEKGFPRDGGHPLPGIKMVDWAGTGFE